KLRTDEHALRVRDRVLLYVRGMTLPTPDTLDIAAEALRRSDPDATTEETMRILMELLTERGALPIRQDNRSWPPLTRRSMIAGELDRAPWLTAAGRFIRGLFSKKQNDEARHD
ncbi:MAG: hypothetical protein IKX79_00690, partial [Desulfovibrionaceae bacterium]|nr:hypothetical protein [Desulfovibrionaceae bacterium]